MNQIEPGDQLRHWVLHLQSSIHFEEVKVLFLVGEELNCAGVGVVGGSGDTHCNFAHAPTHVGINQGGGRFLEHLLMAALYGALALSQPNTVPLLIPQNLHLDVPWIDDIFL